MNLSLRVTHTTPFPPSQPPTPTAWREMPLGQQYCSPKVLLYIAKERRSVETFRNIEVKLQGWFFELHAQR
jgi:hypothetical protein